MTFFAQSNPDAGISTPGQIAVGPRVGFLRGLQLAREQEIRAQNQFSVEYSMLLVEEQNFAAMESLGFHRPRALSDIIAGMAEEERASRPARTGMMNFLPELKITGRGPSGGMAQNIATLFLAGELAGEAGSSKVAEAVRRYDAQFAVLRERPFGPTPQEFSARSLFDGAIARGRRAQREFDRTSTSTTGDLGIFVGGMIGAMDPETSPLVFSTLPLGGAGKTLARRMLTEAAVQAGIETTLMFTGQFQSRRRFNVNFGVTQAATEVLAAAALGGTFQGLLEGGVALGRRFFRDTPADPGPTPEQRAAANQPAPPVQTGQDIRVVNMLEDFDTFMEVLGAERVYGDSRLGNSRMRADLDAVDAQLAPFDGVRPSEVRPFQGFEPPETSTRIPESVEGVNFGRTFENLLARSETIDARAARADPEVVRKFNKLRDLKDRLRVLLAAQQVRERAKPPPEARLPNVEEQIAQQISDLNIRLARAKGKQAERLEIELSELTAQRELAQREITRTDTPSVEELREQIVRVDEKLRDMIPLITRAYAVARDEFAAPGPSAEQLAQVDTILGRGVPMDGVGPIRVEVPARTIASDTRPPNTGTPDTPAGGQTGRAKSAQQIEEVEQLSRERTDEEFASIRAQAAESEGFEIGGQRIELDERITVPDDGDGVRTISIRQLLSETAEDAEVIQTVSTCRVS